MNVDRDDAAWTLSQKPKKNEIKKKTPLKLRELDGLTQNLCRY